MVVTGSTYAFTTLASRLNGGDHIDEKVMAPSSVKVGDVFDQQAFQQANRGAGHLSTGKQGIYETISFGQNVGSMISSSDQTLNSKMSSFMKSLSNNKSLVEAIGKTQSFVDSATDGFMDAFNHLNASDQARVVQDINAGKLTTSFGLEGGITATLDPTRIAELGKMGAAKLGLGGKAGTNIGFSDQLSSANSSSYRKALQKGIQMNFAKSLASADASQFAKQNSKGDISSIQKAAGEVDQAVKILLQRNL